MKAVGSGSLNQTMISSEHSEERVITQGLFFKNSNTTLPTHVVTKKAQEIFKIGKALDDPSSFWKGLQSLDLSRSDITNQQLIDLVDCCPNLHTLNVMWGKKIGNQGVRAILERAQNLRVLDVSRCHITDNAFVGTPQNRLNLHTLSIDPGYFIDEKITNIGIQAILQNFPNLQDFDVGRCDITDAAFVGSLQNFRRLRLECKGISRDVLINIIQRSPNLQVLEVPYCRSELLTEDTLKALGRHCPELQTLDLTDSYGNYISNTVFIDLLRNCSNLRKLVLYGVQNNHTKTRNQMLKTLYPDLEISPAN